jgi:hypothetical protein
VSNVQQIILATIALATAFVSGDYLDSVENRDSHRIKEKCIVTRNIDKTHTEECEVIRNIEREV